MALPPLRENTMSTIRLPKQIEARLDKLAKRTGRTKNFYIHEAILQHLDDVEDLYLAEKVTRRIQKADERVSTLDEVEARFG
jgi:RHH-type transcriptional regulator, rel operon repressor / antitoxin RelB